MHLLITGQTGFKGSWLIGLLASRGYMCSGLSLGPVAGGDPRATTVARIAAFEAAS
ncbi:MAG: hypothetical protein Q8M65_02245 [Rhodoglobus sp.]|nr:hypothetical protein [Rhodoglobus sp.]